MNTSFNDSTRLRFTPDSKYHLLVILGGTVMTLYIWWPLVIAELELQSRSGVDWLAVTLSASVLTLAILNAHIRRDYELAFVALLVGTVIETWGTTTGIWDYYTGEKPPIWILSGWPLIALAVERIVAVLDRHFSRLPNTTAWIAYIVMSIGCLVVFWNFSQPARSEPFTIVLLISTALMFLSVRNMSRSLVVFLVGISLGYVVDYWGTTRNCWDYYTNQNPPLPSVVLEAVAILTIFKITNILREIGASFSILKQD